MKRFYFIDQEEKETKTVIEEFANWVVCPKNQTWAVFSIEDAKFNEDYEKSPPQKHIQEVFRISRELHSMLVAAYDHYSPALAFARRDIDRYDFEEGISKENFSIIAADFFRKYLESQWKSNFVLAEVLIPKWIGNWPGGFFWIVGYTPKIKVAHFVSYDHWIYCDHISSFKLTEEQIARLPIIEMKEYTIVDHEQHRMANIDLTDESLDFDEISEMIRTIR